ncbi:PQQ-dependent sugar dehydrogenase [Adhaeretor mobilis]|uniref:Soluble aldose sugar dehydrogenase YliI n=1 Tax=Adhaeretor mobilis TaxID=1930276 RepID=A0A517MQM3_9BACT|nr:PQQ-dependent sugar dehydrogenase [Adhaeretor mobilis]QDS97185.1 Soluble aldose sugar dehydrogenase YliI precursor [Adhaeretor mobilis]
MICRSTNVHKVVATIVVCLLFLNSSVNLFGQLSNPIPGAITKQGLRVEIAELATLPNTENTWGPKGDSRSGDPTRINLARHSPDGRLFVNDLRGQLYVLDDNYQATTYFDIDTTNGGSRSIFPDSMFDTGLSGGFISYTFHPEFESNGKLYTIHSEEPDGSTPAPHFQATDLADPASPVTWHTVVTEWTASDPAANTWNEATGVRRELLRLGSTTTGGYIHPLGDLQFNPTVVPGDADYGNLYISGGDWGYIARGTTPDGSPTNGQPGQLKRLDNLPGVLYRIDPESPGGSDQAGVGDYTIPEGNPFDDESGSNLDEIYAIGFRNGHRMAWDSDGTLFVSNIGESNIEEVERVVAGGNYGWSLREGTFVNGHDINSGGSGDAGDVFANNVSDAQDVDFRGEEYLYPVAQYDHDEGNAIAGGFFYQGDDIPQLVGKFVFGDIANGRVFAADAAAMKNVDLTDPNTTASIEEVQLFTVNGSGVETNVDLTDLVGSSRADLRFGQTPDGELYLTTKKDGKLRKLVGLSADFNADRTIDNTDLLQWQTSYSLDASADADEDGESDGNDFLIWQRNFGTHLTGNNTATAATSLLVPEASTFSLLLVLSALNILFLRGVPFKKFCLARSS